MKNTRRDLLKLALGAGQLALLDRFNLLRPGVAHAAPSPDAPTKLLVIYVPGGWLTQHIFCPIPTSKVNDYLPEPAMSIGGAEPRSYQQQHVKTNLDGSPAGDASALVRPLLMPRLWDEASLSQGQKDKGVAMNDGSGMKTSPHGWSWVHYKLWENASVVHGVDQETAAHDSGQISMLCGIAGPSFASPALPSLVANAMLSRFPDRLMPHVAAGANAPVGPQLSLSANAAPFRLATPASAAQFLTERNKGSWAGLGGRTAKPQLSYAGAPLDAPVTTSPLDDFVLKNHRSLRGKTNSTTDAYLEGIYDTYLSYSKVLGKDVVDTLDKTTGFEFIKQEGSPSFPFWSDFGFMGYRFGSSVSDSGGKVLSDFDFALRLLKSDLSSAITIRTPYYFDSHNEYEGHVPNLRAITDQIGRLLGEMKLTPAPGKPGKSLLDDTLVLIMSEFARTWNRTGGTDHWPITSVIFAGGTGSMNANRMIGGYDLTSNPKPGIAGYTGQAIPLIDEGGDKMTRPPQSRDIVFSTLRMFGIDTFLSGGPGVISDLVKNA